MNKYSKYVPVVLYLIVGTSMGYSSFDSSEMMWLRIVSFIGSLAILGLALLEWRKIDS
tara:strand:- start:4016 stop:4189 length:174 start_codon:yes stop_codon:yes gene_type:complete